MTQESKRSPFIRLERVYKVYRIGDVGIAALGGVTMDVEAGRFTAIVGPSGAGKSSILNLIGGVETATAGVVSVGGRDLGPLDSRERTEYRRGSVGFLWQGATKNLVPYLTAEENVAFPMLLAGRPAGQSQQAAATLLAVFGLQDRAAHLPRMLSGGEQQRVALAVALANAPAVVLADEPTSELDSESAARVLDALWEVSREFKATVVMATHDLVAAARADATYRLIDGRLRARTGRALLDDGGRLLLPQDATRLLGQSRVAVEVDVEIEANEVRLQRLQPEPSPKPSAERASVAAPAGAGGRPSNLLSADGLRRTFQSDASQTIALRSVSVRLPAGAFVVVMGPSGSGKSTLLSLLGGFDVPDEGRVMWWDRSLSDLTETEVADLRAAEVGVVFQGLGLFPSLSARENVVLPLLMTGVGRENAMRTADAWLLRLGLQDRVGHRVNELSVGQQQRIAVARALAPGPSIVLADEPTTQVDGPAADLILEMLCEVTHRGGAVLVASHDPRVLRLADWVLVLRDGRVQVEGPPREIKEFISTD